MSRARQRLLLLLPTTTYRADAFLDAANRLDIDLTVASERSSSFEAQNPAGLLTLDWTRSDDAIRAARAFHANYAVAAVVGVDDDTAVAASVIAHALGLGGNPLGAVEAARSKFAQRRIMRDAGVTVPGFRRHHVSDDLASPVAGLAFPAVVKPESLSASRGVMRVDDVATLDAARHRLDAILEDAGTPRSDRHFLIEDYVPGDEFAVEGLVREGELHVLTIFEKPDPLTGPFFEETIYLTPARVTADVAQAVVRCAAHGVAALGLRTGPVHIEVRHDGTNAWLIELAARPIGGKCSAVLRFGVGGTWTLEQVVLADALGRLDAVPAVDPVARGVMMLPTPRAGRFGGVRGVADALATPGVTDLQITAHRGQELVPLPEGSRYLGFLFAEAADPTAVDAALRTAFSRLAFDVDP